jgi:ribonuclease BN (tRNA processing enzyme)
MTRDIANMRIRFYGVQGGDSGYPDVNERSAIVDEVRDTLLQRVFSDLAAADDGNTASPELTALLNGSVTAETVSTYRNSLDLDYPVSYGGWTTCVHLETADGHDIVFDCGTGFRNCALDLQHKWSETKERHLFILGSHSHIDHTIGFDQAAVCHDPRNTIHVVGNQQFLSALDRNLGIFTKQVAESIIGVQTPLHYGTMAARFEGTVIVSQKQPEGSRSENIAAHTFVINKPLQLGNTSIRAFEVCHPAPCLAYRIERGGKSFVFCTDHELRRGVDQYDPRQKKSEQAERQLRDIATEADLLYRDGQFQRREYDGEIGIGRSPAMTRLDWGHSCVEDVIEMADQCDVGHTLVGHHEPNRPWQDYRKIDDQLDQHRQKTGRHIQLARAEMVIDL